MDRRSLLKVVSLSLGGIVVTPTLMHILASCEVKNELQWKPKFLNNSQSYIVENLVDIILPSGKNIGAIDVNIPQFIDLILKDLLSEEAQKIFLKGGELFQLKFKELFNKTVLKGSKEEFFEVLSIYFNIPLEKQKQLVEIAKMDVDEVENKELYYIYKFLISIRYYTLFGFYNSKKVGTEILNYNPIPGSYEPCVAIDEVGNVSSI